LFCSTAHANTPRRTRTTAHTRTHTHAGVIERECTCMRVACWLALR
jgi:hypothetical protein